MATEDMASQLERYSRIVCCTIRFLVGYNLLSTGVPCRLSILILPGLFVNLIELVGYLHRSKALPMLQKLAAGPKIASVPGVSRLPGGRSGVNCLHPRPSA